jgi:hypothetical protein
MVHGLFEICRVYAAMLCLQRALMHTADAEVFDALDAIKRIMEIDTEITDADVVLARAGIVRPEECAK